MSVIKPSGIHNLQPNTIPQKTASCKQKKEAATSDSVEINGNSKQEPVYKKDWTVLCYTTTKKELPDSFAKDIYGLDFYGFKDKAHFAIQFGQDKKSKDIQSAEKRYTLDIDGETAKYDSVPIESAESGKTNELKNFLSWGIKNFPAKNYVVVFPGAEKIKNFNKEEIQNEILSNPELKKNTGLKEITEKNIRFMQGFEAFSIVSETTEKKDPDNKANLMSQTAHQTVGAALNERLTLDPEASQLKAFWKKNGSMENFNNYLTSIKNERLMSRQATKEANLSLANVICLKHYTVNGYRAINSALTYELEGKTNALQPIIKPTVEGLEKLPSYQGTVYRKAVMPKDFLKKHKAGSDIQYKSFISTSKYSGWADSKYGSEENVLLKIESVSKGKDISWISECPDEDEILFPPGTKFTVLSNEKKGDRTYIHLCEKTCQK